MERVKTITVALEPALHRRVSAAAKAARQSRSGWMALAAIERLRRQEELERAQPARPVEGEGKGDAA